ncbi:hypothetical protein OAS86_01405 [Gammaproteobacteria bacterium]|nr:hypothetical protein [Gammaproteobacteria bacterium]
MSESSGHHALLYTGPQGSGKHRQLLEEARLQIVSQGDHQTVFDAGNHPDCHVLMSEDAQANELIPLTLRTYALRYLSDVGKRKTRSRIISVDAIRELTRQVYERPMLARSKVVVIVRCESMNVNAANALLKALEEPPADTRFLLASATPWRLPPTILSRCVRRHLAIDNDSASDTGADWDEALQLAGGDPASARAWLNDGRFLSWQAVNSVICGWLADPRQTADASQQLARFNSEWGDRFRWAIYRCFRDHLRSNLPSAGVELADGLFRLHDGLLSLLRAMQAVNADARLQLHAWLVEWALLNHRFRP